MTASLNVFSTAGRRQPAGLTISIPEPWEGTEAPDLHYPPEAVQVRNTFIHVASPAEPEGAYRAALSCPASHAGTIQRTLKDLQEDAKPAKPAGVKSVICLEDALAEGADGWAADPLSSVEAGWQYPAQIQPPPPTAAPLEPAPGTSELPSVGSSSHSSGDCKPCSFLYSAQGCRNGAVCLFCHLCDRSEKKRRQKIMRAMLKKMEVP